MEESEALGNMCCRPAIFSIMAGETELLSVSNAGGIDS